MEADAGMMLKQFGATTSLGLKGLEEFIEAVAGLGLGYLELKCEPGLFYPRETPPPERARLRRAFQDHGISPTVHASFYNINLASLNPLIREASARQLRECLRFAQDLGVETMVIHPGSSPATTPRSSSPSPERAPSQAYKSPWSWRRGWA